MPANIPPLDDPTTYRRLDTGGMLERIRQLPYQCREAWKSTECLTLPGDYARVRNVVVLGMGGSAIGADLVASLVADQCKVPVQVIREYDIPAFVGPDTLAIGSSYSGETEETLSAFRQARDAGARLLAIATGGTLAALAEEVGAPVWTFDYVAQPRAALGFGFTYILVALQRLGLIPDPSPAMEEMLGVLDSVNERLNERVPGDLNPAKQLAGKLHRRLPIVYGGGALSVVARRWKGQMNENAKTWSFFEVLPELDHNAVMGYEFPRDLAGRAFVVLLRGRAMHPRVALRYDVTQEILERAGISHQVVEGEGESALSQAMSTVLFGDYVSFYLALLNGVDPTPIDAIAFLKSRMALG